MYFSLLRSLLDIAFKVLFCQYGHINCIFKVNWLTSYQGVRSTELENLLVTKMELYVLDNVYIIKAIVHAYEYNVYIIKAIVHAYEYNVYIIKAIVHAYEYNGNKLKNKT